MLTWTSSERISWNVFGERYSFTHCNAAFLTFASTVYSYYYAIATFSDVSASEYIMEECNGTEFERTANVFDMMYVPDETEFDLDEFRDEATEEVKGYKGNDFVTDVSLHSR
jgi:hypothetical protein